MSLICDMPFLHLRGLHPTHHLAAALSHQAAQEPGGCTQLLRLFTGVDSKVSTQHRESVTLAASPRPRRHPCERGAPGAGAAMT